MIKQPMNIYLLTQKAYILGEHLDTEGSWYTGRIQYI